MLHQCGPPQRAIHSASGKGTLQMLSPETGENAQITIDVVDVVRGILSVSKLTNQGMQVTFEHQGGSIRKLVRDRKNKKAQKWNGLG